MSNLDDQRLFDVQLGDEPPEGYVRIGVLSVDARLYYELVTTLRKKYHDYGAEKVNDKALIATFVKTCAWKYAAKIGEAQESQRDG